MHRLNFWHLIRYIAALLLIPAVLAAPGPVHAQSSDDSVAYQVETLNSGLPEPPDWIDRSTPRATMQSLITAERTGMWAEAAHLMNLNGLPPGLQAEIGAELASKLTTVIRRKTVVDWTDLLDRPDALDARASDRSATAEMARKSILLWTLDLGDYPAALRLNRLQPENGAPVWVFPVRQSTRLNRSTPATGRLNSRPRFRAGCARMQRWD
ncbi:hypothetical protein [Ovoidimarina sediminis]|uniref:hypothetical protein n=1 Tax=Ovoidimarina sediminis TaxID=3079856 RepID=UPI00290D2705|nr:hypothetical protein [Rhodophyticola sp. MJ-SS7]MDU8945165.1 hypothetical protein [Rhodophyticola sp. MJ-SS7]